MKLFRLLISIYFLVFYISACSKVGALISNTGEYVSKTGEIIGGKKSNNKVISSASVAKKSHLNKTQQINTKSHVKTPQKIVPTALVTIKTTKKVNPSATGRPSRIKITVLQLKSAGKFQSSRITTLQTDLENALGTDFISQNSVSLLPNKEKNIRILLDPSTNVLGVFGSFKQLNNTIWKTKLNLSNVANKPHSILVIADSKSISVQKR